MEVIITFNVARTIIKSSAKKIENETGGILVGTLGNPATIIAAGEPGDNAIHHALSFTSDPDADKKCLEKAQSTYGSSIEPIGYWHKHPLGFDRPSGGDIMQVKQLAADFNDQRPILMGIVNHKPKILRRSTTFRLYSVDSCDNLIEHDWKIVSEKNKTLLEIISKSPGRPGTKLTDYWEDKDFQSYLNPIGRDRIKLEVEKLKAADWQVKIGRQRHNNLLVIDVFDGISELRFLLPPEFPLNPPSILTSDGRYFHNLHTLSRWNSLVSLLDVAENAAAVMYCQYCSKQFLTTV